MSEETFTCATCKQVNDALTMFPGGICLACYEKKMADQPLERPNFIRAINLGKAGQAKRAR